MINYRTLTEDDFPDIFSTIEEAFSDYHVKVKMKMDSDDYRKRLAIEGVKFEHSVGAFDGEKLVGATMNAVGYWNGVPAVHDSGTGVIPEYRRKGVSRGMFGFIIPYLRENGLVRYSLEVIVENEAALKLYEKLGFEITRDFVIYENHIGLENIESANDIDVREIEYPDWDVLEQFWTNEPSWQNSVDCIKRAKIINFKTSILGVYEKEKLLGYATIFSDSGKIAQIAVSDEFRRKGYGKILLNKLSTFTNKPLIVTNIDSKAVGVIKLLESSSFSKTLSQYEMVKMLNIDH